MSLGDYNPQLGHYWWTDLKGEVRQRVILKTNNKKYNKDQVYLGQIRIAQVASLEAWVLSPQVGLGYLPRVGRYAGMQ